MASPTPAYYPPPRRRSIAGPVVLIIIGLLFLLRNFGYGAPIFHHLVRWWPLLLLVWGIVALWEYYAARRAGASYRTLGFGSWVLLGLIICCGLAMTGYEHARNNFDFGQMRDQLDMDNDMSGWFGNDFTYDDNLNMDLAPGTAQLRVVTDRGNVTVTSWDQPKIKVAIHKRVFAGSEDEAQKASVASVPKLTVEGGVLTLNANTEGAGSHNVSSDLDISVPRKMTVEISSRRGDITINGRDGALKLSSSKGDVSVTDLTGDLTVSMHGGSLHATKITGGVNGEGKFQDVELSQVNGPAILSGEFFGDMRLDHLAKGISLHTPRTDLEVARLDGDFNMTMGDIRGSQLAGPIFVKTRSKDVDLQDFTGDLRVNDDNGCISLRSAAKPPLGNIEVTTTRGDVHLALPTQAGFRWSAQTHHGDIEADREFGQVSTNEGNMSAATGVVGGGGPLVRVVSDSGDIELRRVSAMPTPPAPPALPRAAPTPAPSVPPAKALPPKAPRHAVVPPATTN